MSWKLSCTVLRGGVAGNSASLLDRAVEIPGQSKPAKIPFYISRIDGLPLTFAGLWERWGPDKLLSCTIITTEACAGIEDLHSRMPVMLGQDGIERWLAGGEPAVNPNIGKEVSVVPVSTKVNSPRYNEPDCVEALTG